MFMDWRIGSTGTELLCKERKQRMFDKGRCLFFVICVTLVFTLSACNQKQDSSTSSSNSISNARQASTAASGDIDACRLGTKTEAEQVMGEKLKDPDSGPASMQGGTICMYGSPDSLSGRHVSVRVESPRFDWAKYKEDRRVEGEKMQPKRGYVREVSGLGKE